MALCTTHNWHIRLFWSHLASQNWLLWLTLMVKLVAYQFNSRWATRGRINCLQLCQTPRAFITSTATLIDIAIRIVSSMLLDFQVPTICHYHMTLYYFLWVRPDGRNLYSMNSCRDNDIIAWPGWVEGSWSETSNTMECQLSELQTSEHVGHLNTLVNRTAFQFTVF